MLYQFDSNLNVDAALRYEPLPQIVCPGVPADWMKQLALLTAVPEDRLRYHLRAEYQRSRDELIDTMKIIYARLSGKLDDNLGSLHSDQKYQIILKFQEGAENCTEGFHDRLNAMILYFSIPQNLNQLLLLVRMSLVEKAAAKLTNEVHTDNRVYVVARGDGLGIMPPDQKDPYRGNLEDTNIRTMLINTFEQEYRAFQLPFLLEETLRGIFSHFGYFGRKEDGYDIGTYSKLVDYINQLGLCNESFSVNEIFQMKSTDSVAERKNDEKNDDFSLIDINWKLLRFFLYVALKQKYILIEEPAPQTLLDCAKFSALFIFDQGLHGAEVNIIQQWQVRSERTFLPDFLHMLSRIYNEQPKYHRNLINQPYIKKRLEALLSKMFNDITASLMAVEPFFASTDPLDENLVKDILKRVITVIHYFSWPYDKIISLLTKQTRHNTTVIALACRYDSNAVKPLLNYLGAHFDQFGANTIKTLLTEPSSVLMLAAQFQPDAVKPLLDFLNAYFEKLGINTISAILKDSPHFSALSTAVNHHHIVVKPILDFLHANFDKLGCSRITDILLMTSNADYLNALHFMARSGCNLVVVTPLLDFIFKHIDHLNISSFGLAVEDKEKIHNCILPFFREACE
jgi:hypothetical protein